MRRPRWPKTLRELDLFAQCSASELRAVAPLLTALPVDAGQVLMREGTTGSEFMIIATGQVGVARRTGNQNLTIVGPGDFVGELALLDRQPRSATVTALTPVWLYISTRREFAGMLESSPSINAKVTRIAAMRRLANRRAA